MALADDLAKLGFTFAKSGTPALLEMAVREFQRYASLDNVARDPGGPATDPVWPRLVQQPTGDKKYTGEISGDPGEKDTAALIQHWLTNAWRPPLVILAFSETAGGRTLIKENVWLRDEVRGGPEVRFFARDLSGVFRPASASPDDIDLIGRHFAKGRGRGGPVSLKGLGAAEDITPGKLLGHAITPDETSAYRVVRAVAQRECAGLFDCVNGWDNSFVSLGTCHWTLGLLAREKKKAPKTLAPGELGAYLAYLREVKPDAFQLAAGMWGVQTEDEWDGSGSDLFNASLRLYTTHLQHRKRTGANVDWENITSEGESQFMRSWHWFYRFRMAAAKSSAFQQRMWHMTRVRLRDILSVPFPANEGAKKIWPTMPGPGGTRRPATLGEVYSSELLTALLLRLHVKRPKTVVFRGSVGPDVRQAFRDAKIATLEVEKWVPAKVQPCLTAKLVARGKSYVGKDLDLVKKFVDPDLGGTLDRNLNSYKPVSTADLPPAPFDEPLSESLAIPTTAVVEGYADKALVYVAQATANSLVERFADASGTWHDGPPDSATRDRIKRLLFLDNGTILFVFPVLPNRVSRLEVSNAGKPKAALDVRIGVRCLVAPARSASGLADYVDIYFKIDRPAGAIRLAKFRVEDLDEMQNPVPLTPQGIASIGALSKATSGGFPPAAVEIGLKGVKAGNWTFEFAAADDDRKPDEALFRPRFQNDYATDGAQALLGLAIAFKDAALPHIGFSQTLARDETRPDPVRGDGRAVWLFAFGIPQFAALESFNQLATTPVSQAVQTVEAGRPVTFLPRLTSDDSTHPVWQALYAVLDRAPAAFDTNFALRWPTAKPGLNEATIVPRVVYPADTAAKPRMANAEFPSVFTVEGDPLQSRFDVLGGQAVSGHYAETDLAHAPALVFGLGQRPPTVQASGSAPQVVRIGALDVTFLPAHVPTAATTIDGYDFDSDSLCVVELPADDSFRNLTNVARQVRFTLAVPAILPGGQDDVPGDDAASDLGEEVGEIPEYAAQFARRSPLLLTAPPSIAKPVSAPFAITVREIVTGSRSQTVQLQLRHGKAAVNPTSGDAIVLDTQPLLIASVRAGDFQSDLQLSSSDELGNWSNRGVEGAAWELAAGSRGFDLLLPPQGVGEAMHKTRNAGDIAAGVPPDFRFTPNAVVRLKSSYFDQQFAEAPWNLRRVLGYPGQRAPGAEIQSAEYELFYGLYGRFTANGLRLAEMTSRMGAFPGKQTAILPWRHDSAAADLYKGYRAVWATLFGALSTRLAILEPWSATTPGEFRLTQADGLRYELRRHTKLRYPIATTKLDPPLTDFFTDEDGLAGGWAWPFESDNILRAVLRNPNSSDSSVTRLYFSALGGGGHEKASFDGGRTTIYTEVVMGRVASVTLERLGRIGVFHHRAKHVIVYKRTVAASRQFYQEQEPFLGNPLLRKFEEYVELIERERSYPDHEAPTISRGFVLGCSFPNGKPPRIRVNSRWGHDVGSIGWMVPLWVRGAGPADVYPKPTVSLTLAGERPGLTTNSNVFDPEKLCFFTATSSDLGNDPATWPPVEGVDFAAVGTVSPGDGKATRLNDYGQRPDDPIAPGTGAFTLRLDPSAGKVNIVSDRTANPVVANMHTVLAMRAVRRAGVDLPAAPATLAQAHAARDTLANVVLPGLSELGAYDGGARQDVATVLKHITDAVTKQLEPNINGIKDDILHGEDLCGEFSRRARAGFDIARDQVRVEYGAAVASALGELKFRLDQIKEQFGADIQAARQAIATATNEIVSDASALAASVQGTVGEASAAVDDARVRLETALDRARDSLSDATCVACRASDQATGIATIDEARTELLDALRECEFVIGDATRRWSGDRSNKAELLFRAAVSSKVEPLILRCAAQLRANGASDISGLLAEIAAKLDSAPVATVFQDWTDALQKTASSSITGPVEQLATRVNDALQGAQTWQEFQDRLAKGLAEYAQGLASQIDSVLGAIAGDVENAARAMCKIALPSANDLAKFLNDLLLGPGGVRSTIDLLVTELGSALEQSRGFIAGEIENLYGASLAELNHLAERVRASLPLRLPSIAPPSTLQLLRAFGDAPRLPHLEMSLPQLGYYFFDLAGAAPGLLPNVNLTPVLAKANDILSGAGRELLNALNIHLPSKQLLDRFIPDRLERFDVSELLPNIAGISLRDLLSGLKTPNAANENVRVTHGVDAQTQSAWLQADMNISVQKPAELFSIAGLAVRINGARFDGRVRVEVVAGQPPLRKAKGSLGGDWEISIGGTPIAQLVNCRLDFEEGGPMRFDISPDRVRLQQALQFISNLVKSIGIGDSGFSVALSATGIRSNLQLPLPDVQAGSVGIANLNLGFFFGVDFLPAFKISTGLSVGRRLAPFTVTVFILGGAGFLETEIAYTPGADLACRVSIGIFAAASLAISLGPISGGVYAYFGITVEYAASHNGGGGLAIALLILFRGEVSLLGFITVGLEMGLEALWDSKGTLTGRGHVSYSIKIGWFIDIHVSVDVSYTFGSGAKEAAALAPEGAAGLVLADRANSPYVDAGKAYVRMFAA